MSMKRIILTTGGTGGHISRHWPWPTNCVAAPGIDLLFMGGAGPRAIWRVNTALLFRSFRPRASWARDFPAC